MNGRCEGPVFVGGLRRATCEAFVARHKDLPVSLYLAFKPVHSPLDASPAVSEKLARIKKIRGATWGGRETERVALLFSRTHEPDGPANEPE